jgi:hypothetical protein
MRVVVSSRQSVCLLVALSKTYNKDGQLILFASYNPLLSLMYPKTNLLGYAYNFQKINKQNKKS